jgi:imidazolonepropionase-like amidohydrolase
VLIRNGSDIGVFPHGQGYQELEMLVKYGMTPLQALRCATSDASKLLDLQNKVGIVREGMIADLAAFEGDPSKEIKDVRKVKFVMKSGTIYKQP